MYDLKEQDQKTKPHWSNYENSIVEDDTVVFLHRLIDEQSHASRKLKIKLKIKCKYKIWN